MKKNLGLFLITIIFAYPSTWAKEVPLSTADEFFMDTPIPLPCERVTLDFHSEFSHIKTGSFARLPAMRANVGVYRDFQLYGNFPAALNAPKKGETHYGYGDMGLGFKYRFIHETDILPAVAFYPKLNFPSGNANKGLGNKTWTGRFPLWFQKKWGDWKVTTGGGYFINPAKDKFNYPFGGVLIQWQMTNHLMLGNEFFAEGKMSRTNKSRLICNFGGSYFFNSSYFLAFSAGHSIAGAKRFVSFLGFGIAWGPVSNP